jgi:hypothetical protein
MAGSHYSDSLSFFFFFYVWRLPKPARPLSAILFFSVGWPRAKQQLLGHGPIHRRFQTIRVSADVIFNRLTPIWTSVDKSSPLPFSQAETTFG